LVFPASTDLSDPFCRFPAGNIGVFSAKRIIECEFFFGILVRSLGDLFFLRLSDIRKCEYPCP
jgi:hypothetical protein